MRTADFTLLNLCCEIQADIARSFAVDATTIGRLHSTETKEKAPRIGEGLSTPALTGAGHI